MTRKLKTGLVFAIIGLFVASSALAATPTLTLVNVGGGSVQVSVVGDPNSTVQLYYNSGSQSAPLGSTNSSGAFSSAITTSAYGIVSGNSVYVMVNGQQSASQSWPYTTTGGAPTLSQTSVTVGLGQTVVVTSQTGAAIYLSSNSNPTSAAVIANGSQITVTGNQIGSTVASICYVGTASNCTNVNVTVQNASTSLLTFSQTNVSLSSGGSQAILIYGGNGTYSISMNSNTSAVSTSVSGSTLTLYGLSAGTATLTLCDQNGLCGSVYVTTGTSSSGSSVTFGVTNPTVSVGQTTYVSLSGGSSYYISSNANTSIVQASVSGSTISLYGASVGSTSIAVCVSGGSCNTLSVTVTSAGNTSLTNNSAILAEIQSLQTTIAQMLTQIQTIQTRLVALTAAVGGTTTANTGSTASYKFYAFLGPGSENGDVTALQQRLQKEGFFVGSVSGYYGAATEAAVKSYQRSHGISPLGYVGPGTRAALNGQ